MPDDGNASAGNEGLVPGSSAVPPSLASGGGTPLPRLFRAPGEPTARRFIEFFTAHVRNASTRKAYYRATSYFAAWCDTGGLTLHDVQPVHVAAYIEQLLKTTNPRTGKPYGKASVKQHLAALRMLFDWLVVGQIIPFNPAAAVRGPRYQQQTGATPYLEDGDVRVLLGSIDTSTIGGLRDRALLSLMLHTFARISAALAMTAEDYYRVGGKRWFFRLRKRTARY